ncbi:MAG: aminodeoxychorismate/anthranilate synthase component II [Bacteroidetes bacterium]|nr:aminodeoxychorismate/anthranilate synthase component II [Bacteroidota bacterium]MBS1649737.1 aminodeoxychorismate/anthranilate synthase component II [Bacteroidota bacterium]
MKILILDNYDSFTYNLVHLVEKITKENVDVFRNDEIILDEIKKYDKIILSPGPGIPSEAGLLLQVIKEYASTKTILGVCLGHQAIGEAFGGTLTNLSTVFHGVATNCKLLTANCQLFAGMSSNFEVGRYHSWVIDRNNFPEELEITAEDDNGFIMALQHKTFDIKGVQFHPESVLTPSGETIIRNWLSK